MMMMLACATVAAMTTATAVGLAIKNSSSTVVDQLSTVTRYSTAAGTELVQNNNNNNGDPTDNTPITESELNSNCKPNMLADFRKDLFFTVREAVPGTWYFINDNWNNPNLEERPDYSCKEFCQSCAGGYFPEHIEENKPCDTNDGVWNCRMYDKPADPVPVDIPDCDDMYATKSGHDACTCVKNECHDEVKDCFVRTGYDQCKDRMLQVFDEMQGQGGGRQQHSRCDHVSNRIICGLESYYIHQPNFEAEVLIKCGLKNCGTNSKFHDYYMKCITNPFCSHPKDSETDMVCAITCAMDAADEIEYQKKYHLK